MEKLKIETFSNHRLLAPLLLGLVVIVFSFIIFSGKSSAVTHVLPGCYKSAYNPNTTPSNPKAFIFTKVACPKNANVYYKIPGPHEADSHDPSPNACYVLNSSATTSGGGYMTFHYKTTSGKGFCSWMYDHINTTKDAALVIDDTGAGPTDPGGGEDPTDGGGGGEDPTDGGGGNPDGDDSKAEYKGTPDPVICKDKVCGDDKAKEILNYIIDAINLLAALVGVIVVAVFIVSGIRLGSSAGNPEAVASAKKHIMNAIIALVVSLFIYALISFIIPGGTGFN